MWPLRGWFGVIWMGCHLLNTNIVVIWINRLVLLYFQNYMNEKQETIWRPHKGPQTEVLKRTEHEILYGGARGGGKTDSGLAWLLRNINNPQYRALIIRKNADDLSDWIDRARTMYRGTGATFAYRPAVITFPSGAIFKTGHLKDDNAYGKYLGHEYHKMVVEELTQIPTQDLYLKLISSCRSTVKGLHPQIFLTTNPGGVGHAWVKKRFVDVGPPAKPFNDPSTDRSRIFIPAKVTDNPTLVKSDPGYLRFLDGLPDNLRRAWRDGDWDVFAGQAFPEFRREFHVTKPVLPKKEFSHFLGIDWGYTGREQDQGAFAALASALVGVKHEGQFFHRVITYREWYGKQMTSEQWAEKIYKTSRRDYSKAVCDSSMFNLTSDGSKSISDRMKERWDKLNDKQWLSMERGTRNRIGSVEALHNWMKIAPDGLPYWLITENCHHLIRTIPLMVHDENKFEDIDSDSEDHLLDAARYLLSYIKYIPAHLGAVNVKPQLKKALPKIMHKLDLSKFEKAKAEKKKDWRVV